MLKRYRKVYSLFLVLIFFLGGQVWALSYAPDKMVVDMAVAGGVRYLHGYYAQKSFQGISDWSAIALAAAGEAVAGPKWTSQGHNWITERKEEIKKGSVLSSKATTDYARTALAVTAVGQDPRTFAGVNLIQVIKKAQCANGKFGDTIDRGGQKLVNAHIWSIITLYAAGEPVPMADSVRQWLVKQQQRDGGFSYYTSIKKSDVDVTAHALVALACLGEPADSQVVQQAFSYLKRQQADNGGFIGWAGENCESTAAVLEALTFYGIDPYSARWDKKRTKIVEYLLKCQNEDGSFAHVRGGSASLMATEQALLALTDYRRGITLYQQLHQQNLAAPHGKDS